MNDLQRGTVSSPITVLFLIDTLEVGGTEQSLLQLVRELPATDFRCIVCSIYRGWTLEGDFQRAGATVIRLDVAKKYGFAVAIGRVLGLIDQYKPDVVHTMLFRANQIGRVAAWRRGVPAISSFVNVPYDAARRRVDSAVKPWKLRMLQCVDTVTARLVSRFHSVSEYAKSSNCSALHVDPNKVVVIPRGRDMRLFERSPVRRDAGHSKSIVCVGRLIPQKGHRYLIQAMPIIATRFPTARLNLIGDGPLHDELSSLAQATNASDLIALLGRRSDVPELLMDADVFAFPSLYEGLPGALIEAMFAGCPIVASDIPQVRELIEHGVTGLIVPTEAPESLADAIIRLISDSELAQRLGAAARRVACERYDIQHVTDQMGSLYRDVAFQGRR